MAAKPTQAVSGEEIIIAKAGKPKPDLITIKERW